MTYATVVSVNEFVPLTPLLAECWETQIWQFSYFAHRFMSLWQSQHHVLVKISLNNSDFVLKENQPTVEFFYNRPAAKQANIRLLQIVKHVIRQEWQTVQLTNGSTNQLVFGTQIRVTKRFPCIPFFLSVPAGRSFSLLWL